MGRLSLHATRHLGPIRTGLLDNFTRRMKLHVVPRSLTSRPSLATSRRRGEGSAGHVTDKVKGVVSAGFLLDETNCAAMKEGQYNLRCFGNGT
jgi:hypothetical protein